jgi:hypothetical protein
VARRPTSGSRPTCLDRLEFPARGERVWSRLVRLRALASASPRLSVSAVLQANGVADLATANLRLRYSVREGHDLWLVYNTTRTSTGPGRAAIPAPRARPAGQVHGSFGR